METEHARALQAVEARSKQAGAELLQTKETHTAQVADLKASHAEALQQQKSTLEQQLAVRSDHCWDGCPSCSTFVYLAPVGGMPPATKVWPQL